MFAQHFATHRIAWSRGFLLALVLFVFLGSPPKLRPTWLLEFSEMLGFFLLAFACLWRIWCALFISGTKNGELAATGPYSVVRNPLYIGTFLGVVGFGFAVEQPLLAAALGAIFAAAYPSVVANEERHLDRLFGERYAAYCARVPRWIPNWSLYEEPASMTISPRRVRGAILDAMWFLWAFALCEFIEELHHLQLLPALF